MAKKTPDKDRARLQSLIEEATVDCYDEHEEHMGMLTMIEENVVCPFKAKVIGEVVEVVDLRYRKSGVGVDEDAFADLTKLLQPGDRGKAHQHLGLVTRAQDLFARLAVPNAVRIHKTPMA